MSFFLGFDFRDIETFVAVVDEGSVTRAAQKLGVSQSSVSQILSGLEASLRVELLDRSGRPLRVTEAGRYFYDSACALLKEARSISRDLRKADYSLLRHVKLALVDSIITAVGKDFFNLLRQRTQSWSLVTGQSHLHAHWLLSRQADMIITDDNLDDYHDLQRFNLLREPFVVAVSQDYSGPTDLPAILESQQLIRYSANSVIGQQIERYLRREQVQVQATMQLDNSFALATLVAAGIGAAITTPLCLFRSGYLWGEGKGNIQLVPLQGFARELCLACRENELGDLPEKVAEDCRKFLRETYLLKMQQNQPELAVCVEID